MSQRRLLLPAGRLGGRVRSFLLLSSLCAAPWLACAQTQQSAPLVQLPDVNALQTPPARVPIFYPPDPPAPGAAIDRVTLLQLPRWDAPAELAAYPGELFYPVLGTQIAEKELGRKLRERVAAYRSRREALAAALRSAEGAPAGSAADCLSLLAEEEKLRRDLTLDDFHWNRYRQWAADPAPGKDNQALAITRQFQLLRAAVHYRESLSTDQRALLRAFVLWFARFSVPAAQVTAEPVVPGGYVSFLPAPSFVRLPDVLPRELALEFQGFLDAKHAVQRELALALIQSDGQTSSARRRVLETLAKEQQPKIDALEARAESLRAKLAKSDPAAPPLAGGVAEGWRGLMAVREALEQELVERLVAVRRQRCTYRLGSEQLIWKANFASGSYVSIEAFRTPQELMAVVDENYAQAARPASIAEDLRNAVAKFKTDTAARQNEFETQRSRVVVAALHELYPDQPLDQPIPAERVAHAVQRLQQDERNQRLPKYADYLTATLRTGLTPAQRRVLLNQALADLNLPLPPGVRRPVFRLDGP